MSDDAAPVASAAACKSGPAGGGGLGRA